MLESIQSPRLAHSNPTNWQFFHQYYEIDISIQMLSNLIRKFSMLLTMLPVVKLLNFQLDPRYFPCSKIFKHCQFNKSFICHNPNWNIFFPTPNKVSRNINQTRILTMLDLWPSRMAIELSEIGVIVIASLLLYATLSIQYHFLIGFNR